MPNYDDLFTSQPAQGEETPFDKDAWAAKKQAEREGVYAMIDSHVHDMGVDGGVFQGYLDVQARFDCQRHLKMSIFAGMECRF